MNNSTLVANFIEQVWNNRNFHQMEAYLHPNYVDHSLPPSLPAGKQGTEQWIMATSAAFEHYSIIEDHVTEGNKSIVKISMHLKHIGAWRGIEPYGTEVKTTGYRHFKLQDGKIIEHWALIDGERIEKQLTGSFHGCKVPQ